MPKERVETRGSLADISRSLKPGLRDHIRAYMGAEAEMQFLGDVFRGIMHARDSGDSEPLNREIEAWSRSLRMAKDPRIPKSRAELESVDTVLITHGEVDGGSPL